jgi:putative ATP-dependent endonuclease of the OLD family
LLTDFRIAGDPQVARLSYVYRKKPEVSGAPQSSEDCEFIVYGGGDESRDVPSRVRRRIALDMLDALRDAEGQLASWRSSPLRPLLEDAVSSVSRTELEGVATYLEAATKKLESFQSVKALEDTLRSGILDLAGSAHNIDARLRSRRPIRCDYSALSRCSSTTGSAALPRQAWGPPMSRWSH